MYSNRVFTKVLIDYVLLREKTGHTNGREDFRSDSWLIVNYGVGEVRRGNIYTTRAHVTMGHVSWKTPTTILLFNSPDQITIFRRYEPAFSGP